MEFKINTDTLIFVKLDLALANVDILYFQRR